MGTPITESTYYILLAVLKPNHGYGIIQRVEELTNRRVSLGAGTLYGAINTLLEKGWIMLYSEEKNSRRKKEYLITNLGKSILLEEIDRLEELIKNGRGEIG
ncbi:PadR family transcriptional regulator [Clostridium nigeriense]|uniref:PadR family transcriptional regulator n=1 Tax=Clostridium nigeriense TaxID=1805470 RepID=UPI00083573AB|nr:helix-turn-helix transcriptional regulator [Clostridium nigeriense]